MIDNQYEIKPGISTEVTEIAGGRVTAVNAGVISLKNSFFAMGGTDTASTPYESYVNPRPVSVSPPVIEQAPVATQSNANLQISQPNDNVTSALTLPKDATAQQIIDYIDAYHATKAA